MTTLDERLRAATDALGDAPHDAPPFGSLRNRRHRGRATALVAAVATIALVCVVAAVAARDGHPSRSPARTGAPTPSIAPTTGATASTSGSQALAAIPRLPASSVHTVHLSRAIGNAPAVFAGGSLWAIGLEPACPNLLTCPWLFRIDPATGAVSVVAAPALGAQGAGPLAVGDGAAFAIKFDYQGQPMRVFAVDLATGKKRFDVAIPGTSVEGNPKARIEFGDHAVWVSEGSLPVTELDAQTGAVRARIALPQQGAETNGTVGTAFNSSGLWLVGGDSGTTVMRVDPATKRAAIVVGFGAGFSQSLAADDAHVWTTHFAGNPAVLDLVRIDLDHPDTPHHSGIPTPQVAVGGGQVWFAGYEPGTQAADPRNHYGAVGRIDPVSLKVVGVTDLPGIGELDEVQLFTDAGGAWVYLPGAGTITRIASAP